MIADEGSARAWLSERMGCDGACLSRLDAFVAALRFENTRQNLVSAASLEQIWSRHIVDSAQLLPLARPVVGPWLDLGTGAGFPGLIVALLRPGLEVVLVESRPRRAGWLAQIVAELGAEAVRVLAKRIEAVPRFAAATISARAFAPLSRLLPLAAPFSTGKTTWLLPKGRNGFNELNGSSMGIRRMFHVEPSLTDPEAAILVGRGIPDFAEHREAP